MLHLFALVFSLSKGSVINDLALLKIQRKGDGSGIRFSNSVAPACLPREETPQKPGTECTVSGWGKTKGRSAESKIKGLRAILNFTPGPRVKFVP
jgi:hypothetical protein